MAGDLRWMTPRESIASAQSSATEDASTIKISVNTLMGGAFLLEVDPLTSVRQLKDILSQMQGIPVKSQSLIFSHRVLPDDIELAQAGVTDGASLSLVLAVNSALTNVVATSDLAVDTGHSSFWLELDGLEMLDVTGMSKQEQEELLQLLVGHSPNQMKDDKQSFILCRDGDKISMLQLDGASAGSSTDRVKHTEARKHRPSPPSRWDAAPPDQSTLQSRLLKLQENTRHRIRMADLQLRMAERKQRRAERGKGQRPLPCSPSAPPNHRGSCQGSSATSDMAHRSPTQAVRAAAGRKLNPMNQPKVLPSLQVPHRRPVRPPLAPVGIAKKASRGTPNAAMPLAAASGAAAVADVSQRVQRRLGLVDGAAAVPPQPLPRRSVRRSLDSDLTWVASGSGCTLGSLDTGPELCDLQKVRGVQPLPMIRRVPEQRSMKPAKPRCWQCARRLRITATYTCRCGGVYCSDCRHPEVHTCTFDYKSQGRKILAEQSAATSIPSKLPEL